MNDLVFNFYPAARIPKVRDAVHQQFAFSILIVLCLLSLIHASRTLGFAAISLSPLQIGITSSICCVLFLWWRFHRIENKIISLANRADPSEWTNDDAVCVAEGERVRLGYGGANAWSGLFQAVDVLLVPVALLLLANQMSANQLVLVPFFCVVLTILACYLAWSLIYQGIAQSVWLSPEGIEVEQLFRTSRHFEWASDTVAVISSGCTTYLLLGALSDKRSIKVVEITSENINQMNAASQFDESSRAR